MPAGGFGGCGGVLRPLGCAVRDGDEQRLLCIWNDGRRRGLE